MQQAAVLEKTSLKLRARYLLRSEQHTDTISHTLVSTQQRLEYKELDISVRSW